MIIISVHKKKKYFIYIISINNNKINNINLIYISINI